MDSPITLSIRNCSASEGEPSVPCEITRSIFRTSTPLRQYKYRRGHRPQLLSEPLSPIPEHEEMTNSVLPSPQLLTGLASPPSPEQTRAEVLEEHWCEHEQTVCFKETWTPEPSFDPAFSPNNSSANKTPLFDVSRILNRRVSTNGIVEYLIEWAGYGPEANSWEPEHNLFGCESFIEEFEAASHAVMTPEEVEQTLVPPQKRNTEGVKNAIVTKNSNRTRQKCCYNLRKLDH